MFVFQRRQVEMYNIQPPDSLSHDAACIVQFIGQGCVCFTTAAFPFGARIALRIISSKRTREYRRKNYSPRATPLVLWTRPPCVGVYMMAQPMDHLLFDIQGFDASSVRLGVGG